MKKIVRGVCVAFCIIYLGGCAFPEKPMVSHSPPTTPPPSSSPVYIQDTDGQTLELSEDLAVEGQQDEVGQESGDVVLPSALYINDRIFEYGRKLNRWKELDSQSVTKNLKDEEAVQMVRCFRRLQDVLTGYSDLREKLLQTDKADVESKISNAQIFELQKNDIAFLENACGRLLADGEDKAAGWSQREVGADLSQLETLLERHAANKEYEEVVQVWRNIPEAQRDRLRLGSKVHYGNALMYLDQEAKAAEIYQQVVDQMSISDEQATDLVSLRKMLADLYTASGNYRAASTEYTKISDDYRKIGQLEEWSQLQLSILDRSQGGSPELNEFSGILRSFLGYIPERDGYKVVWQAEQFQDSYPYSLVISNVEFMKNTALEAADRWYNGFVTEVDRLSSENKFSQAIRLLETMPTDIIGAEKQMQLQAKNEELGLAEAVENETGKMARMQDLQNQWNNGMLLANGERYEEAIDVFTSLLDTEYSTRAVAKIQELSLNAAKADRRKAADLFIRFTKTTDLESRKKLLVESRKYLKNILVKYPEVEIASKVRGNIERVEQEMNAIDPNLVYMADQEFAPVVRDDVIDRAFTIPDAKPTTLGIEAPIIEKDLQTTPIRQ